MTYAQYGLVEASDYNNLIGTSPGTTANKLNTVWATGGGSAGYGQAAVSNVSIGGTVTASQWNSVITNTANSASHQGSSITSVSAIVAGGTITFLSAIPTNLTTIYTNRLNAAAQGSTSSNAVTRGSSWSNALIYEHTITFTSGDTARYFFNSGGQIAITASHPAGSGINTTFNGLASNIGTVVLSSPTSGTITVSGVSYNGVTKIGGGGNSPTISSNNGYYALTTSNANVFTQTASSGYVGYLNSFIRVVVKSNGTQGSNSDAGSVITIYTVWDEVPNGQIVSSGSVTTCTIRPPSTSYIANTWGAIGLSGSVSGS